MNHRVLAIGLAALFAALLAPGASGAPPARSPVADPAPSWRRCRRETGSGTVDEFVSNSDGSLTALGTTTGLPAGIEGIAST